MPGQTSKKAAPAKAVSKPSYGLGLTTKSFELDLPSGNTCLAIRPGAQGLIKHGLLDSMDQLTGLVQTEHIDSKDPRKVSEAVKALSVNKQQIEDGLAMVDKAIVFIVQQPKVWLDEPKLDKDFKPVIDEEGNTIFEPRKADRIYADEVDIEDKMFIFNWALGGTADLKSFREESAELLGNLSAG